MTRSVLILNPNGWPCTVADAPPGLFIYSVGDLSAVGFKSEYKSQLAGGEFVSDAYDCAGEFLDDRVGLIVQPVHAEWTETENL